MSGSIYSNGGDTDRKRARSSGQWSARGQDEPEPKILYIAGYGRSGSTVLGALLGSSPGTVHLGELAFLAEDWAVHGRRCSCGALYEDCDFWGGALLPAQARGAVRARREVERLRVLPRLLLGLLPENRIEAYRASQGLLLRHVLRRSRASVLVDGSKTAWATAGRPLALRRLLGCDLYLLHIVRDGRAVLRSIARFRSNWEAEGRRPPARWPLWRSTVGWVVANLTARTLGALIGSDRYLRLRYEDFCSRPGVAVRQIGRLIDEDLSELEERIGRRESTEIGHVVGGSRLRFAGSVTLRPAFEPTSAGRPATPWSFTMLASWLNRVYGYGLGSSDGTTPPPPITEANRAEARPGTTRARGSRSDPGS